MIFRHQLAVYSPITAGAIINAGSAAIGVATDARRQLLDLLLREYSAHDGLLCGSGTQALQVAITIARRMVGGSTPVALPAFNCFDVASAAVGADAPIALYDIDPTTLGPDLESLDRVLGAGARVCVVASLYGLAIDWDAVTAIAERHDTFLIEDAAQAHGATWHGRPLGSLADISTLSFGRGKGWTGGAGGVVLFRGSQSALGYPLPRPTAKREVSTAIGLVAQWMLGRPSIYGIPRSIPALGLGGTHYKSPSEPRSITRTAATGLMATRAASLTEAAERRVRARQLLAELSEIELLRSVSPISNSEPGYLRLPVRLREQGGVADRTELSARLHRLGIERSYPKTLGALAPLEARLVGPERRWPGASTLVRELVTVPTHSRVSAADRVETVRTLCAASHADGVLADF